MAAFASRKFVFCVGLVATATWMLLERRIGEVTWLTASTTSLVTYASANVGQKGLEWLPGALATFVSALRGTPAAKAPTPSP